MSSLKMTFSLASLVLILGLIAMPVMAQEDMTLDASRCYDTHRYSQQQPPGTQITSFCYWCEYPRWYRCCSMILPAGIPDLEERFLTGTTIALLAPVGFNRDGSAS